MSEWQPIETAPKDGTAIDVWTANAEFPQRHCNVSWRAPSDSEYWAAGSSEPRIEDGEIDTSHGWFGDLGYKLQGDEFPSHWMPLPEPPQ